MKNELITWKKRELQNESERREHPFDMLQREVNGLLDTYFKGADRAFLGSGHGVEVSETDDEIRVKAEMPGLDKKDIQISVQDDVLSLRGEHREEHKEKKRKYHISKMSYGAYHQSIHLPAEVDAEKADAKFKRGVLTLHLPKTEQAKTNRRRIAVYSD